MKRKELVEAISSTTKVGPKAVNAVINAVIAHLQAELANGEKATLAGLGTFVIKPPAQEGKPERIIFRPAVAKEKNGAGRQSRKSGAA